MNPEKRVFITLIALQSFVVLMHVSSVLFLSVWSTDLMVKIFLFSIYNQIIIFF